MSAIGDPDDVEQRLSAAMDAGVRGSDANGTVCLDVAPDRWLDALLAARDHLGLDLFDWLSAVDQMDADPAGLDVVAHLVDSTSGNGSGQGLVRAMLRTRVPASDLRVASATGVWRGAAWHERETHEMFGIGFEGNPRLEPLLLSAAAPQAPLRKDSVLVARAARPWPGEKDPSDSGGRGRRRRALPPGVPDDWPVSSETSDS